MNDEGIIEIAIEPEPVEEDKITVGVIIPIKNSPFLEQCLDSILDQDAPSNIQIVPIVVSSASVESFNKVKPYRGRVNAILTRRHCEAGSALNLGLKWLRERFSSLNIVVCVSSDDVVSPSFVSSLVKSNEGQSKARIYSAGCVPIDEDGKVTSKKREDCDPLNFAFNEAAINKLGAWHSDLSYAAGREMALRADVANIKVESISSKVYRKRSHRSQMSNTITTDAFTREGAIFKSCKSSSSPIVKRGIVDREICMEL